MTAKRKTGGRRKGTPNAATAAIRASIEAADPVTFLIAVMENRVPELDKDGQSLPTTETPTPAERIRAAEFLARRISPEVKERPVAFDLDEIAEPADAVRAIGQVATALANGSLLPSEAKAMNDALSAYLRAFETSELSERLDALEAALKSKEPT